MANNGTPDPRIELRGIKKSFGPIRALSHVDLKVHAGEVLGLLGDNGAGKSTVMKILAGSLVADAGDILIDGREVRISDPRAARAVGIEMIYQDLALCDDLDVASNFFLGQEPRRFGLLDLARMHREAAIALKKLGSRIQSTHVDIKSLSGGQRQTVAIGRALQFNPRVLIMDEPTAALGVKEAGVVVETIKAVKAAGVAVILISHRMQEILDVCDRGVLISEGRNVIDFTVKDQSIEGIANIILNGGRERLAS
ncbi:ATP-binding cassette domain-containing protein [Pseudomonas sp. R2.Fl]|nr:ATP-binding cassette domain-containing protein [Pseudomonas sp. R2.Fl]